MYPSQFDGGAWGSAVGRLAHRLPPPRGRRSGFSADDQTIDAERAHWELFR